ncbi:MAG: hypothetical protein H7Y10_03635 [Flavobacterium sp.]|nr:hypothetical protein [Flavobacterium sp.]
MGKQIEFRLTDKRTPASWTLSGGYAVKPGFGSKLINYYPGSDSIFVEDQKSDVKAKEVEFFYNDVLSDPATSIFVDENNKCLLDYLKAHTFFNAHYYIHNEDQLAENKLADYDKIEKAFSLIKENDDLKVQAMALTIFKEEAFGWSPVKCKSELKEKATRNPDLIINAMESDRYESRYLAALAFYSGIVKEDQLKSAIVWNDEDNGVVLRIAKGENGITKLGELLATSTDESTLVLQEIGIRLNKSTPAADVKVNSPILVSGKTEAEIKAEAIAEYKASLEAGAAPANPGTLDQKTNTFDATDLVQVQAKYKEVFAKEAPINKKNNLDWLNAEIEKGI